MFGRKQTPTPAEFFASLERKQQEKEKEAQFASPQAPKDDPAGRRRFVASETAQTRIIQPVPGGIPPVDEKYPNVEVCSDPKSLFRDIDCLTLINHTSEVAMFHGIWRSVEVAIKVLATDTSEQQLEATISTELLHPHVVQCYAARSMIVDAKAKLRPLRPWMEDQVEAILKHTATEGTMPRLKGVFKPSTTEGSNAPPVAPVVCSPAVYFRAEAFAGAARPSVATVDVDRLQLMSLHFPGQALDSSNMCIVRAGSIVDEHLVSPSPHPGLSPFVSWACVSTLLKPKEGKLVTILILEYGDVQSLQSAIYDGTFVGKDGQVLTDRQKLRAKMRTVWEVASALHHMHTAHVLHGDIQPGNVMLMSSSADMRGFTAKIGNMHRAMVVRQYANPDKWRDDTPHTCTFPITSTGPNKIIDINSTSLFPYAAPEVITRQLITKLSDIYSLGVLMWEVFHETKPYVNWCEGMIKSAAQTQQRTLPWTAVVPIPLIDLVARCLSEKPTHRPNAAYVACCLSRIDAMVRQTGFVAHVPSPEPPLPLPRDQQVAVPQEASADSVNARPATPVGTAAVAATAAGRSDLSSPAPTTTGYPPLGTPVPPHQSSASPGPCQAGVTIGIGVPPEGAVAVAESMLSSRTATRSNPGAAGCASPGSSASPGTGPATAANSSPENATLQRLVPSIMDAEITVTRDFLQELSFRGARQEMQPVLAKPSPVVQPQGFLLSPFDVLQQHVVNLAAWRDQKNTGQAVF